MKSLHVTPNSPLASRPGFFLTPLVLACFALLPSAPAADGGRPNQNTAEGTDALFSLTTGVDNTAVGFDALYSITDASEDTATGSLALANDTAGFNTAFGFAALKASITGQYNTAIGRNAMFSNTTGINNTATGGAALGSNTTGAFNTATGRSAMFSNTTGEVNTADGYRALYSNTTGNGNTASGFEALLGNTTGERNTANGFAALFSNTTGNNNTANGVGALSSNTTGHGNIALGSRAGINLTTGSHNIDIGNLGMAGESDHIRIGRKDIHKNTFIAGISGTTIAGGVTVVIDTDGHLGTATSSERFKDQIKPMDEASEAILGLQPVTFHYKHELDPAGIPQFGLVAEQVAKVNPDLVARDSGGKVYTVRYEAVNAMLLNEFLREHRTVQEQGKTVQQQGARLAKQEATLAKQQKQIEALTNGLQKVSTQIELSKSAPQTVVSNQ